MDQIVEVATEIITHSGERDVEPVMTLPRIDMEQAAQVSFIDIVLSLLFRRWQAPRV